MKQPLSTFFTPNNLIYFSSLFLCFSIALPHIILPGKAGLISLFIFSLWIFSGNLKGKMQILYRSKLFLTIIAFIIYLSLSMLWTTQFDNGLVRLSTFKYFLFLIPVLITEISNEKALKLIHAFVLGTLFHALLIILFSNDFIQLPDRLTLYSPYSVYAPFFVFSSFYCFFYFIHNINKKNIIKAVIYSLCLFLLIYLVFTNKGRSGQLAFVFSAVVSLILLHKSWSKTIFILIIITSLVTTIILSSKTIQDSYTAAASDIKEISKGNYRGSWGVRWGLLVTNIEVIKKHPVFGVGLGDTQDAMQRVIARGKHPASYTVAYFDGSHNHYVTILTASGITGFILYIAIHIFLFRLPIKNTETKYLSLIFLTILIITSIADDILFYKPYNIFFAIMIALFINLASGKNTLPDKAK